MSTPKKALVLIWIACLVALVLPGDSILITLGRIVFGLLVIAHAIECFVFRRELREAPGELAGHLAQVFLFGIVHMQEIRSGAGEGSSD